MRTDPRGNRATQTSITLLDPCRTFAGNPQYDVTNSGAREVLVMG